MMTWVLVAIYVRYKSVPQMEWQLYGVKSVMIAVVLKVLWTLGKVGTGTTDNGGGNRCDRRCAEYLGS